MAAPKRGELPKDLAQGRNQFQAWRASRKRGRRIPQTLWTLAVRLVKTHGLSRTAMALGLDYYRLKKQAEKTADQPQSISTEFVELPSPVVVGKQGVFELDNGTGARMCVQLLGYDAVDVVALLRNFWRAE